ncbi:MAG: polysaccharide pyruvyl transferase family protein [Candidatus Bathyarchaeota archaeon]|nr:polysaccharide pyruvyl transferase family protein [Candidatus Bathyarchaeota archaeon]
MKIIFLNTHSTLNSGDAGIVLAQIQFLEKKFSNLEIALTSRTPERDLKFYNPMGIKVFCPIIPAPSIFTGNIQKIEQSLKNLFAFKSKRDLIKETKKSDLVISSGGGYFYSNRKIFPGPMFFQNFLHAKLALILNKPVIFFPQSFGPFYNPVASEILRDILESDHIVKIFAREKTSFDFLYNLLNKKKSKEKIDLCPDIAFYLNKKNNRCDSRINLNLPRPIVAITLRQWDFPEIESIKEKGEKQEGYLTNLEEICHGIFYNWGGSVVIFPQARGPGIFENDIIISRKLWEKLKKVIPEKNMLFINLPDVVSPLHIINILSQVNLVIATRLHSAIFALITGVPVISITYQPKSKGIMEVLELEHFGVNITHIDPEEILRLTEEILNHHCDIQRKIHDNVSHIRKTIEIKLESTIGSFY